MFNQLNVEFPTLSVPLTRGYSLHSHHARYEHEMHTIRFIDWNVDYTSISDGTPLTVTLTGIGSSRVINGYIHHIVPDISSSNNYVDIIIIGASRVFKQQSQNIWKNATADQVITDIAKSQNFSYVSVPHPRVFEQISQAGMSDWELMVKLAKQCGYSLKANNTSLYFQPITQEFTELREEAAYFRMQTLNQKSTGIYSFHPMIGESIPYHDAKKTTVAISGVDKDSKNTHTHTNQTSINTTRSNYVDPIFDSYHTHVVAPTYEAAQYEAAAADEINRYAYRGEVVLSGAPTILPDSPIYLDGIGSTYSGYWTALSVEHNVLGNKEFTTKVMVGTDSLGLSTQWTDSKTISAPSSFVKRVITPGVRQINLLPKTTLKKTGKTDKESLKKPVSLSKNVNKTSINSVPTHAWIGTGNNLKAVQVKEQPIPPIAMKKIRSAYGK
jgi:phage protein D